MKQCYTCKETKPLTSFGYRYDSRDGRAHWCLECARAYHREYRRKNPERIRSIQKRARQKNHENYLRYQRYVTQLRKEALDSPDGIA